MNNILEEYAVLESEIKALESKKEQLRPLILKQMIDSGNDSLDIGIGKFVIAKLKKWTYSKNLVEFEAEIKKEIADLNDNLKAAQEKEKSNKEATCEESESLRFTPINL